jgi:hypothetical protein
MYAGAGSGDLLKRVSAHYVNCSLSGEVRNPHKVAGGKVEITNDLWENVLVSSPKARK